MRAGRGSSIGRSSVALLTAAVGLLLATPTGASAATQVGETFEPSWPCHDNINFLQSASPGAPYGVPHDGVLTAWSFRAPASGTDLLKFKVGRPAGGDRFTVVGDGGALVDPVPATLNTYSVRIPVFSGDLIGYYWNVGNTALCSSLLDGYHIRNHDGDVPLSTTASFTEQTVFQLDVAAVLEPDCDKDGLGDESQDQSSIPCPTCRGRPATIIGTSGNDVRRGTPGRDVMAGLAGKDRLSGLGANDIICGGAGKDTLKGGKGKDKLYGEAGKDTLKGGPAKDKLNGGPGRDRQVQ
jgi:Ca2+-binding RTX toxin-like protein